MEALDGFVAEGDIEGLRLLRVRADERREGAGTCIAFHTAPDGVHVGGDGDQFGEVAVELAVVVRRVQQPFSIAPAIGIVEDGEAREVDTPAVAELDARPNSPGLQPLALHIVADRAQDVAQRLLFAGADGREHRQCSRSHVAHVALAPVAAFIAAS